MKRYQLDIELLEDLHSGNGTGAGDYDALLARDSDGKPMIPASHWVGVWRYNLQRSGLHKDEVNTLFGKAGNDGRKAVIATALYWDEKGNKKLPLETVDWTSTSREDFSRVAEDNTLRTREFIPAGAKFKATLWLRDENLTSALETACRLTDCLGARRQRGDGRITASLKLIDAEKTNQNKTIETNTVRLLLRALDPLCFPITGSPDNLIRSACYIRGQTLRGTLVEWLLKHDRNSAKQLLTNSVVGNAYPVPCKNNESWEKWQVLPIPLNFATAKPSGAGEHGLPWWASQIKPSEWKNQFDDNKQQGEKLKRPSDHAFIFSSDGENWQSFNAELAQRLRNSPPTKQNPDGSLFAQEEIPEQTLFLAELTFPIDTAPTIMQALSPLLQKNGDCLAIGRGGSPLAIEDWHSYLPSNESLDSDEQLTITLTSDLIARSPYLGFYDQLTPQVLIELLGMKTTDFPDFDYCERHSKYYGDYVQVYGFNPCTGLPRLPALAIRRGSSLQIKGTGVEALREKLAAQSALGERTDEGFGRFRLDFEPDIQAKESSKKLESKENIEETLYAKAEQAFTEIKDKDNFPALAQWQALRFHDDKNKSLAELIEEHSRRLKLKEEQNSNIAWLKPCKDGKSWIDWLIAQLNPIPLKHQQLFYKALLVKVRLKLRQQEETS